MGALLAVAFRDPVGRALAARAWPWAAAVGAVAFVALGAPAGFDMHQAGMEIWSHTALAITFGGLLAGAVAGESAGSGLARALSAAPLRALGRISYGVYVWHYFVHVGLLRALRAHPAGAALLAGRAGYLAYVALGVALSLVIAWASYHLVEKRFLALKDRFAPRRQPAALAA